MTKSYTVTVDLTFLVSVDESDLEIKEGDDREEIIKDAFVEALDEELKGIIKQVKNLKGVEDYEIMSGPDELL
jgi:hypothetical protein